MKKMLCIFLSIFLLCSPAVPVVSFATETSENISAKDFVSQIENIMLEDTGIIDYEKKELFDENTVTYSEFRTCKLIVKSKNEIDTHGASAVVSGYNDLWILKSINGKYKSPLEIGIEDNLKVKLLSSKYEEEEV